MDFHALPRRDLQALCKRNAIRANMSNAAMADALRSLQSVKGIDEIRTAAPPEMSAVKSAAEEVAGEEQRHGCPLPHGGRSQATTRRAAANKTEEGAPVPETLQQMSQNTAPRDTTVSVETEAVSAGKRRTRRSRRSKVKEAFDQKEEAAAAELKEPIEPTLLEMKLAEEVGGEEPRHGCPLPRSSRSQAATKRAVANKADEVALTTDSLQRSQQNTAAQDATVPVDAEAVSTGKRKTRRSRRSKTKMVSDHNEDEAAAAQVEPTEPTLFEEKSTVEEEHHHGCPLPRGGRGRATRSRAAAHKTEDATPVPDTLQRTQKTAAREAAVPMETEEVSTGKRRTRRSRRSKVQVALVKKEEAEAVAHKDLIADTSDAAIGPAIISEKRCDDPKEEAVVNEKAEKHQDGEMHYENPSICSGKKQKRRSRRQKVKMVLDNKEEVAATVSKELIADSSNGAIGSAVVSDNNCDKEEKVDVVEVGATNFQKGVVKNQEPTSTVQNSPSLATMAETGVPVIAQDVSVKGSGSSAESYADEMTVKINPPPENKEHGFSLTGEPDQSYLLVNTLDRFVKPMCKFPVKEETKQGECWWMLM
ncbi:hypothetical protein EJB05_30312 [Eragrostis curvula]|uniref:Uncharacterized protein n=1 Tax=Eragrostis curvula TaxID=38414 RepID=A0A5J9UC61_9POAL|nr:hypothetical protein EJB05_30312 [Eragrostis curvula]